MNPRLRATPFQRLAVALLAVAASAHVLLLGRLPINWDEFFQVIKGNGPCNRERLAARRKAHEDGAWVRVAANAYAEKRAARGAA